MVLFQCRSFVFSLIRFVMIRAKGDVFKCCFAWATVQIPETLHLLECDKEKQQILVYERLELESVSRFCLKNDRRNESIEVEVVD